MGFVSAILVSAKKLAGTAAMLASPNGCARLEKTSDQTGDAAPLLESCLPRSFGI
jgi:hypothetical protein